MAHSEHLKLIAGVMLLNPVIIENPFELFELKPLEALFPFLCHVPPLPVLDANSIEDPFIEDSFGRSFTA